MDLKIKEQEENNMRYHLPEKNQKIQENKLKGMKENRTTFVQYMQNPRCVVKFYNAFRRNMHRCHNQLFVFGTDENKKNMVHQFVRTRNIGQIVSFLSFLEVCMPDELQQIVENGADYIEPVFYEKDVLVSKDQEFMRDIASVTVYRKDSEYQKQTSYMMVEMRRFINRFLEPKFELHQLIKPFTTQEDEWKNAIENKIESSIDLYWHEMINMVLEKMPGDTEGITNQWKEETFAYLLEYANRKVGCGTWDKIQKFNVTTTISEEAVNDVINFSIYYSYNKVDSIYKLFQYISTYEQSAKMKDIKEILLNSSQTMGRNLLQFVDKISEFIPNLCSKDEGWYEKFNATVFIYLKRLDTISAYRYNKSGDKNES